MATTITTAAGRNGSTRMDDSSQHVGVCLVDTAKYHILCFLVQKYVLKHLPEQKMCATHIFSYVALAGSFYQK